MASTKCPSCGLDNFSSAMVCRRCFCPLMGEFSQSLRSQIRPPQKPSYRWLVKAALASLALAVLLVFLLFLINVIPSAMHSSETRWSDFTPEQWANMKLWYFVLVGAGVALIFLFFFSRRDRDK